MSNWRKENPEKVKEIQARYDAKRRTQNRLDYKKNIQLKANYGISIADYERMYEEQNGQCKICGATESHTVKTSRRFAVDHCHKTGQVRGLLCIKCNAGIGMFNDDADLLISAISYLREYK